MPRAAPRGARLPGRFVDRDRPRRARTAVRARFPAREVDAEQLLQASDVVTEVLPELEPVFEREWAGGGGLDSVAEDHLREVGGSEVGCRADVTEGRLVHADGIDGDVVLPEDQHVVAVRLEKRLETRGIPTTRNEAETILLGWLPFSDDV